MKLQKRLNTSTIRQKFHRFDILRDHEGTREAE